MENRRFCRGGVAGEILALLAAALVLSAVSYPFLGAGWRQGLSQFNPLAVSVLEVKKNSRPILWVDARHEPERLRDPGPSGSVALNEDTWNLEPLLLAWKPPQAVVVFCDGHGCQASRKVAERLAREMPALSARFLEGGLPALRQSSPESSRTSPP